MITYCLFYVHDLDNEVFGPAFRQTQHVLIYQAFV